MVLRAGEGEDWPIPGMAAATPPPPSAGTDPRKNKRGGLRLALALAAFLLLITLVGGGIAAAADHTRAQTIARETPAAGAIVTDYFTAVGGHNWPTAQQTLDHGLRAQTSIYNLQVLWGRREAANGRVTRFDVEEVQVTVAASDTTALVIGTVYYTSGFSDLKVIRAHKERDGWYLTTLP